MIGLFLLLTLGQVPQKQTPWLRQFLADPARGQRAFQQIMMRYRVRGRWEELAQLVEKGLEAAPTDTLYLFSAVEIYAQLGDSAKAMRAAQALLRLQPRPQKAQLIYYLFQRRAEMRSVGASFLYWARRFLGKEELFAPLLYTYWLSRRDFERALEELKRILLGGERQAAWVTREVERLVRFLGEEEVLAALEDWGKRHPENTFLQEVLAGIYMRRGELGKAMQAIRRSGNYARLNTLARQALLEGHPALAYQAYLQVPEAARTASWQITAAQALKAMGRRGEAIALLEAFVATQPDTAALRTLVDLLFEARDLERALAYAERESALLGRRIRLLMALGRDSLALSLCRSEAQGAEALYYCGFLQLIHGEREGGQDFLYRLVERYPMSPLVNDALFYLDLLASDLPEVEIFLEAERARLSGRPERADSLIQSAPRSPLLAMERARILEDLGRYPEALDTYAALAETADPVLSPRAYFEAARIARDRLKDPDLAERFLKTLILTYPDSPYATLGRSLL